ncbi:MAG TPA: hypothetical protein VN108_11740, partial [Marmoricola sp.]|nr:hypothetical protein [Marmoricola sp.]
MRISTSRSTMGSAIPRVLALLLALAVSGIFTPAWGVTGSPDPTNVPVACASGVVDTLSDQHRYVAAYI